MLYLLIFLKNEDFFNFSIEELKALLEMNNVNIK